jgi:hypothetical protein
MWRCWQLDSDRHVLELDERLTPPGCALELELHDGQGIARSYGVWRLSQSGALLAIVEADDV